MMKTLLNILMVSSAVAVLLWADAEDMLYTVGDKCD